MQKQKNLGDAEKKKNKLIELTIKDNFSLQ